MVHSKSWWIDEAESIPYAITIFETCIPFRHTGIIVAISLFYSSLEIVSFEIIIIIVIIGIT